MKYSNSVFHETRHYIKHVHYYTFKQKVKYGLIWLVYWPLNIYQKLLINLLFILRSCHQQEEKKYPVVIIAMFKNEAQYLREWIEYYKQIGIDHFFLYNNNSEDNYMEILSPYIKEGIITLKDWPIVGGQIKAYEDWYKNYKSLCNYYAFIDIDEFICPVYDSTIKEWLYKYRKYPVLKMDWFMFGTSSQLCYDSKNLLIETFCNSWKKRLTIGKSFYNASYEIANSPNLPNIVHHLATVKYGIFRILPFNDTGNIAMWFEVECKGFGKHTIQINHYYSRSLEGLKSKLNRGDPAYGERRIKIMDYFYREDMNISKDYTIHRFLLKLKMSINKVSIL